MQIFDNYDWNEQQKQLLNVLDNLCITLNENLDIVARDGRYLRVHFMNNNNHLKRKNGRKHVLENKKIEESTNTKRGTKYNTHDAQYNYIQ